MHIGLHKHFKAVTCDIYNMKAFEESWFSGNNFTLMFFHTCIITMITLTYFVHLSPDLNLLFKLNKLLFVTPSFNNLL